MNPAPERLCLPGDVAMQRPHARVVGIDLEDEVAGRIRRPLQELHVSPLWVLRVGDRSVPGAEAFGQDPEVVAVEVHGVDEGGEVADDEADGGVGAEVVDGPLGVGGVGDVAELGEEEDGVVVVAAEGDVVHVEEEVAGGVGGEGDVDGLRRCGSGGRCHGEEWGGAGECCLCLLVSEFGGGGGGISPKGQQTYVTAGRLGVGSGNRVGRCGGVSVGVIDRCQGLLLFRCRASGAEVGAHPVGTCRLAGGFHQDVGALTDAENHHLGFIWDDGDEVIGDDRHGVAVDGEELCALSAGIDESQSMHFSGLKAEL